MSSIIEFLIGIVTAIPILDKWANEFSKQYHRYQFDQAEKKAAKEGNTEDLQKEMGREK